MAERRRIIEGTWTCNECGTEEIPGRKQKCTACGSPREDREADFDFGERTASGASTAAGVDDDELKERARAGEDWNCQYCESANVATAEACKVCGAARWEKEKKDTPPPPPDEDDLEARTSGGGGGALAGLFGCGGIATVGAFVTIGAVVCFWAFFMTSESQGKVTGLSWERTVVVERFSPVTKEGWRSELPSGSAKMPVNGKGERPGAANVRGCTKKEKTPEKCETKTVQEQCGTKEKCEVKDLGNGFAEEVCKDVPKYCKKKVEECTDAVIDEWCTYDTHTWKKVDEKTARGTTEAPSWPKTKKPGRHDRAVKSQSYTVTISYEGSTHTHRPSSAPEFGAWKKGQSVVVTTNNLGAVTNVRPK